MENSMNEMYQNIINAVSLRDFQFLKECKEQLNAQLQELDKFYDEFLEKYTLNSSKSSDDNWSIYRQKTSEYSAVIDNVNVINYYMRKYNV